MQIHIIKYEVGYTNRNPKNDIYFSTDTRLIIPKENEHLNSYLSLSKTTESPLISDNLDSDSLFSKFLKHSHFVLLVVLLTIKQFCLSAKQSIMCV